MIGPNFNFIFIEPPKNATTSVRNWIMSHGYAEEGPWRRHWRARELLSVIDPGIWHSAYKFSITRLPYSRLTSEYLYYEHLARNPSEAEKNSPHTRMAEYIFNGVHVEGNVVDSFKGFLSFPEKNHQHYLRNCSLTDYLRDTPGEEDIVLCKMENLSKDFSRICKDMKWENDPLPKHNESVGRKSWESFYDDEALQMVNSLYARDFKNFDYPKYVTQAELPNDDLP